MGGPHTQIIVSLLPEREFLLLLLNLDFALYALASCHMDVLFIYLFLDV